MSGRNAKALAEGLAAAKRGISDRKAPNRQDPPSLKTVKAPADEPTERQMADSRFELSNIVDKRAGGTSVTIGTAYRRKPMIDMLMEQGAFTSGEYRALKHYRHHADIADRSPSRDSLNMQRHGGSGVGTTVEMLNAVRVRNDCERAAGSLVDILRAVVVYDRSLSQWAMDRSGSIEECETRKGKRMCRMKPKAMALRHAQQDIRMAAKRVQAELDA